MTTSLMRPVCGRILLASARKIVDNAIVVNALVYPGIIPSLLQRRLWTSAP
jgi:hypothetical protein